MGNAPTRFVRWCAQLLVMGLLFIGPAAAHASWAALKPIDLSWHPSGNQVTWIELDADVPSRHHLVSVDRAGIKRWLLTFDPSTSEAAPAPSPSPTPEPEPEPEPVEAATPQPTPQAQPPDDKPQGLYDLPGDGVDLSRGLVDLEGNAPTPTPRPPAVVAPPIVQRQQVSGPPQSPIPLMGYEWTPRGDAILVSSSDDLYIIYLADGAAVRLTRTPDIPERHVVMDAQGQNVAFGADGHLWLAPLDGTSPPTRLTPDAPEGVTQGELDWAYAEELVDGGEAPIAFSPQGDKLAYLVLDNREVHHHPMVDHTALPARETPQPYPLPGGKLPKASVQVIDTTGTPISWWDLDGDGYIPPILTFTPDGKKLAFLTLDRSQETQRLHLLNLRNDDVDVLNELTMPHWHNIVGGPTFLPDGKHYILMSPYFGFVQPYLGNIKRPGKKLKRLVNVPWNLKLLGIDPEGEHLYLSGSGDVSTEQHFFEVNTAGGGLTRITLRWGWHDVTPSPSMDAFVDTFSSVDAPPQTTLWEGRSKLATLHRAQDTPETLPRGKRKIVSLRTEGDVKLYGELFLPERMDTQSKHPAVIMVYGGPAVQTVTEEVSPNPLVQRLLDLGIVVWRLDGRGSGGRMHRFETAIDGNLGATELSDQLLGLEYLKGLSYIDPQRIAIMGGSYGGFLALYAMTHCEAFAAAVALAPVTDWRRYDALYTERYMGLPQDNPSGYSASSVVETAHRLSGPVFIIHGIGDANVHVDHTFAFYDAALKAGLRPEVLILPSGGHRRHSQSAGERSLMMERTVEFLRENLDLP